MVHQGLDSTPVTIATYQMTIWQLWQSEYTRMLQRSSSGITANPLYSPEARSIGSHTEDVS